MSALNILDLSRVGNVRLERIPHKTILHPLSNTSSSTDTRELTITAPLHKLRFRLTGVLNVVTAGPAVLKPFGCLNLISTLTLKINSNEILFNTKGIMMGLISDTYSMAPVYKSDPAVTVGANAFEAIFEVPVNSGPGMLSILDPLRFRGGITLVVEWAPIADMATAAGGGTVTISAVELEVLSEEVRGNTEGAFAGNPKHVITTSTIDVAATQVDLTYRINNGDILNRLVYSTLQDGAPVNTILNKVKMKVGQTEIKEWKTSHVLAENYSDYNFAAKRTGQYILDVAGRIEGTNSPRIDQFVVAPLTSPNLVLNLLHDVTKVSGVNTILMIIDKLVAA